MSRVPPAMSTRLGTTTRKDAPGPETSRFTMPNPPSAFLPSFYHVDHKRNRSISPFTPRRRPLYKGSVHHSPVDRRRTGDAPCEDPVAGTLGILDPGRKNGAGRPLARGEPQGGGGSGHGTEGGTPA